jgi:hypothetical protein
MVGVFGRQDVEESKENEEDIEEEQVQLPSPETFSNTYQTTVSKKVESTERKWKRVIALLVMATIGVIVVAIVIGVTRDDGGAPPPMAPATIIAAPTPAPIDSPQEQLNILREGLAANNITANAGYLDLIPTDAASLKGKFANETEDAVVRAASWLVHEDPLNQADQIVSRFALAVIYLQTAGPNWIISFNWLSGTSICEWYGVRCGDPGEDVDHELADKVRELDLNDNNLQGQLPETFALLREMRILWLNDNSLSGQVPGEAIGSLPLLLILYLHRNQFTGPIPTTFRNNGILGMLCTL